MLESFKEWKMAITSVKQGYESTEEHYNYKTSTGVMYGGQGMNGRLPLGHVMDHLNGL